MFTDRLTTTLSLSIGSDVHALVAGQVERFELDMRVWGFSAEVTFFVSSEQEADPIFEGFSGTDLICATLAFVRETEGATDTAPLSVTGYAIRKGVYEVVGDGLKGAPVVGRHYELQFVDAAQAFWTQHHPVELHVQASMQDMLEANKPTGVAITYDWSAVSAKQAILMVGLDGEAEPSFYDFLIYWIDRNQGVFEFDATTSQYRIAGKKSSGATPTPLVFEELAALRLQFPEPPRFVARVLQSFGESPLTKELPNALASGVRRDVLMRTPITAEVTQRAQVETSRLRARAPCIELTYQRCPVTLVGPLGLVSVEDGFSTRIYPAGTTYRVLRLRASALHKPAAPVEPEDISALYEIELSVEAEESASLVASLPPFRDPRRTLRVEGKIVSAGSAGQRTWAAIENEDNSLWMYKVFVPMFNKEVPAPFTPGLGTGHFFFPAYKDQRVLVDLDFDRAAIAGFLDWADEGRLPSDSQGNQIVLGFQSANGTVIRHSYVDAIPVLNVERKASVETSTLTLGDGTLRIALEQSSAVPTTIPLYDVSPQVEAAKDAVVGEVGGSVTEVTTQFEAAVGQISSSIEDTSAAVAAEIADAERELTGRLDAAETELQGLLADASAAVGSLAMGGTRAKARLSSALQSVDELRAPLIELQARFSTFRVAAHTKLRELEVEIDKIPGSIAAPLDVLALRAAAVRGKAKNGFASLKSSIDALGPKAKSGAFAELTRFRQNVQGLQAAIAQASSGLDTRLDAFVRTRTAEWTQLDASLARARTDTGTSLDRASAQLDSALARVSGQLRAKLASASAATRTPLVSLDQRLTATSGSVRPQLKAQRERLDETLAGITARVAQGRTQLTAASDGALQGAKQGITAAEGAAQSVLSSLDSAQTALESAAQASTNQLVASLSALEQAVLPPLDAVPDALATIKRSLQQAAQAAVDSCKSLLSSINTLLSNIDSAVNVPLKAALAALDAAESTAQTTLATASQTLDSTVAAAQSTVQSLVSAFEALVDGAGSALTAVRGLVQGARAQIMPPIDALVSLVDQLQSIFQTGVNLLTAFVDTAHAALDAIPAASLPKAAVQPAITAISAALDAVLPVIQTAAKTAGDQLTNLGTTLSNQVATAEQTGLQAVTTFVATLTQQIDAVLPPLREQLAGVQTQIDSAIETVLNQLDQATTLAINGVTQTFEAVGTQVQSVVSAAETQLGAAQTQLGSAADNVTAQIASQRVALAARAEQLLAQVASNVDRAADQLDATAAQIESALAKANDALKAQVAAALDALQPRVDSVRAQLAQLPETLDQRLQPIAAQNRALIAEITAAVPSSADIDAAVNRAAQPLSAAVASVEQELAKH